MPLADDLGIDSVLDVVRDVFGIEGKLLGNGEFRILCPVHETDGLDHDPSCDVNLATGQWNCFSCSASSDIIGLGNIVLGLPRRKVQDLLRPNEPSALVASVKARVKRRQASIVATEDFTNSETIIPINDVPPMGSYEKGPFDVLYERGFTKDTLKRWGIRFVSDVELRKAKVEPGKPETFALQNNIAIPIQDMTGKVAAWCYRATPNSALWQVESAKYIYTPGLLDVLNRNWFGLYRHQDEREIAVVEGALDAMWLDQCGIPAVAMLGTSTKQFEKVEALTRFRRVTIVPDRDGPGLIAAIKLGDRLQSYGTPVRISLYREWMTNRHGDEASDPQDLCPLDVELVHATALPWQVWRRQPGVMQLASEIRSKTEGKQVGSASGRRR